jgi:hypothetical protein
MARKKKLTLTIAENLNRRLDFEAINKGKDHDRSSIVDALVDQWIKLPEDWQKVPFPEPEPSQHPTAKPVSGQQPEAVKRLKTTFYVSPMTDRLIGLHAKLTGEDRSSAVERLIGEHIAPWGMYDTSTHHVRRFSDRSKSNDPANNSERSAA